MCRACIKPTKECENCGLMFKYSPSQERKYCSMKCYAQKDLSTGVRKQTRGWKGQNVGYRQLHRWVQNQKGKPTKCEWCGAFGLSGKKLQWANISREYKRELSDFMALCASCHNIYDEKYKYLPQGLSLRDSKGRFTGVFPVFV